MSNIPAVIASEAITGLSKEVYLVWALWALFVLTMVAFTIASLFATRF